MVVSAISDGIRADHEPPLRGAVYSSYGYTDKMFYSDKVSASWLGFVDKHSFVKEYEYAISTDIESPVFVSVGLNNHIEETSDDYIHGSQYFVHVKATDAAGHVSNISTSTPFVIDKTAPVFGNCLSYTFYYYSFVSCDCHPIVESGLAEYCECSTNRTVEVVQGILYKVKVEVYNLTHNEPLRLEIGSHMDWVVFDHAEHFTYEYETFFVASNSEVISPRLLTNNYFDSLMITIYDCDSSSDGKPYLRQSGYYGTRVIHPAFDNESYISHIEIGLGTNEGGFQLLPLHDFGNQSSSYIVLSLQHNMTVYGSAIVTNHAGLQICRSLEPITIDWTPPVVENINVIFNEQYPSLFLIEAQWNVHDYETAVTGCFWTIGRIQMIS